MRNKEREAGNKPRKRVFEYCGWIITHEGREVRPYPRNGNRGDSLIERLIVPKYQRDISGIEEQVISLYTRGMSTRDSLQQYFYMVVY
ncbi:MAG: hypothetical protein E7248_08380 [Paenibacillaceae bacterium]|nr:hypothetical protein [Paenibacillaceae bacterium]